MTFSIGFMRTTDSELTPDSELEVDIQQAQELQEVITLPVSLF